MQREGTGIVTGSLALDSKPSIPLTTTALGSIQGDRSRSRGHGHEVGRTLRQRVCGDDFLGKAEDQGALGAAARTTHVTFLIAQASGTEILASLCLGRVQP